jgi:hypothetical protein
MIPGCWIEITDALGGRVGPGPLRNITSWQCTREMDRIGTFNFELPLDDERAALLEELYRVKCYNLRDGVPTLLGTGIIQDLEERVNRTNGSLSVSGEDNLAELRNVSAAGINLSAVVRTDVAYTWQADPAVALPAGLPWSATFNTGDYWYVGSALPFANVAVTLSAVNNNASVMTAEYFNGMNAWQSIAITDGTALAGATLGQSGTITFAEPGDWSEVLHSLVTAYWLRFKFSATTDAVTMDTLQCDIVSGQGMVAALGVLIALCPGWSVVCASTQTIYLQFEQESVFEALAAIAEQSGEHFYLSGEREITWVSAATASGLRACQVVSGIASEVRDNTVPIIDLARRRRGADLVTRIRPRGTGHGQEFVSLANADYVLPAGYAYADSGGHHVSIYNTAAEALYGTIERCWTCEGIGAAAGSEPNDALASNALAKATVAYLAPRCALGREYDLTLGALPYDVYPTQTIGVQYRRYRAGRCVLNVDEDLYISQVSLSLTREGMRYGLAVASVTLPIGNERDYLGRFMAQVDAHMSHEQTVNASTVRSGTSTVGRVLMALGNGTSAFRQVNNLSFEPGTTCPPGNHNLLSAPHPDTVVDSPVRGDLITGQGVNPYWQRLAKGTTRYVLRMFDANDPGWETFVHAFIGADHTGGTDAATARTTLGLGTLAVQDANAVAITGGTIADVTMSLAYRAITALRTLDATDYQIDCTANSFTVTLPTAASITGRVYSVKNSGTGTITVATTSSQTIDGATTAILAQYDNLMVMSNGANWIII